MPKHLDSAEWCAAPDCGTDTNVLRDPGHVRASSDGVAADDNGAFFGPGGVPLDPPYCQPFLDMLAETDALCLPPLVDDILRRKPTHGAELDDDLWIRFIDAYDVTDSTHSDATESLPTWGPLADPADLCISPHSENDGDCRAQSCANIPVDDDPSLQETWTFGADAWCDADDANQETRSMSTPRQRRSKTAKRRLSKSLAAPNPKTHARHKRKSRSTGAVSAEATTPKRRCRREARSDAHVSSTLGAPTVLPSTENGIVADPAHTRADEGANARPNLRKRGGQSSQTSQERWTEADTVLGRTALQWLHELSAVIGHGLAPTIAERAPAWYKAAGRFRKSTARYIPRALWNNPRLVQRRWKPRFARVRDPIDVFGLVDDLEAASRAAVDVPTLASLARMSDAVLATGMRAAWAAIRSLYHDLDAQRDEAVRLQDEERERQRDLLRALEAPISYGQAVPAAALVTLGALVDALVRHACHSHSIAARRDPAPFDPNTRSHHATSGGAVDPGDDDDDDGPAVAHSASPPLEHGDSEVLKHVLDRSSATCGWKEFASVRETFVSGLRDSIAAMDREMVPKGVEHTFRAALGALSALSKRCAAPFHAAATAQQALESLVSAHLPGDPLPSPPPPPQRRRQEPQSGRTTAPREWRPRQRTRWLHRVLPLDGSFSLFS